MIHSGRLYELVTAHQIFSIKWVSASGEVISVDKASLTSFYSENDTFNIKILSSGEIRKVNKNTVIEFNSEEVIL